MANSESRYQGHLIIINDDAHWIMDTVEHLKKLEPTVKISYWLTTEFSFNVDEEPPEALYFAFCTASCSMRNANHSFDVFSKIYKWLQSWGRRVINGEVMELEGSKAEQIRLCKQYDIPVPKTLITAKPDWQEIKRTFEGEFLVKPDRGGSGIGIKLFSSPEEFKASNYLEEHHSSNGIYIVQEFLDRSVGFYRCEFVGEKFLYMAEITPDPERGDFNMCPCSNKVENYKLTTEFHHPIRHKFEQFIKKVGASNIAFEMITDASGTAYVIDINTNTSFNTEAENFYNIAFGFEEIAKYLKSLLNSDYNDNDITR